MLQLTGIGATAGRCLLQPFHPRRQRLIDPNFALDCGFQFLVLLPGAIKTARRILKFSQDACETCVSASDPCGPVFIPTAKRLDRLWNFSTNAQATAVMKFKRQILLPHFSPNGACKACSATLMAGRSGEARP